MAALIKRSPDGKLVQQGEQLFRKIRGRPPRPVEIGKVLGLVLRQLPLRQAVLQTR